MTRTNLPGWLAGLAFFLGSAPGLMLAQSGEDSPPPRAASRYAPPGTATKATGGTKSQPSGGAASQTKGPTYGPVQPKTEQPRTGGQSPIRRTAGDEPVREPGSVLNTGGTASKAGAPKGTVPKGTPGSLNNPIPVPAQFAPRQPDWFPLSPNVQDWVDEVLVAWEKTSEEIVTFKCSFKRWEHDPTFGPANPKIPFTYGKGIIQYAKPDKGMFKVESMVKYSPPKVEGGKPEWLDQIGEQWICDGRSIFEFDTRNKLLKQTILLKEMQGKAIADGPLPFLFGAKVAVLKARYWIRPAPNVPEGHQGEYWLEAVPRTNRDAANFQKVSIILDEKDFLPKALDVYAPNYNSRTNPAHTEYLFEKRETTLKSDKRPLDVLKRFMADFGKQFYEPELPSGWKKGAPEDMNKMPQEGPPVQGPAAPGTATRPSTTKTKTK